MKLLSCITLSLYLIGSSLSGQNTAASLTSNQTIKNDTLIAPLNELIEININLYDLPFSRQVTTVRLQRSWTLLFGVIYKKIADLLLR